MWSQPTGMLVSRWVVAPSVGRSLALRGTTPAGHEQRGEDTTRIGALATRGNSRAPNVRIPRTDPVPRSVWIRMGSSAAIPIRRTWNGGARPTSSLGLAVRTPDTVLSAVARSHPGRPARRSRARPWRLDDRVRVAGSQQPLEVRGIVPGILQGGHGERPEHPVRAGVDIEQGGHDDSSNRGPRTMGAERRDGGRHPTRWGRVRRASGSMGPPRHASSHPVTTEADTERHSVPGTTRGPGSPASCAGRRSDRATDMEVG